MRIFGLITWCGRSHVEYSQLWRKARLPVEVVTSPSRWLLRKRLLRNWELPFGRGLVLWRISESQKEVIIDKISSDLLARGDAFEVEP
jgi:hypothetical protein